MPRQKEGKPYRTIYNLQPRLTTQRRFTTTNSQRKVDTIDQGSHLKPTSASNNMQLSTAEAYLFIADKNYLTMRIEIAGRKRTAIIDAGADVNLCTSTFVHQYNLRREPSTTTIRMPNGRNMESGGTTYIRIHYGQATLTVNLEISKIELPKDLILGAATIARLQDQYGCAQLERDDYWRITYDRAKKQSISDTVLQLQTEANSWERTYVEATGEVTEDLRRWRHRLYLAGQLQGTDAIYRWDTGSHQSICRASTAFCRDMSRTTNHEILALQYADGTAVPTIGTAQARISIGWTNVMLPVLIVPDSALKGGEDMLLGLDWTAEIARTCHFAFDLSKKRLLINGFDVAFQRYTHHDRYFAKVPRHDAVTTTDSTLQQPTGTDALLGSSNEDAHDDYADIAQSLEEERTVNTQLNEYLTAAYAVGERVVKERNHERQIKEEWKHRALEAEDATRYWSQGFADLSAKVRQEQRTDSQDTIGENKRRRHNQSYA